MSETGATQSEQQLETGEGRLCATPKRFVFIVLSTKFDDAQTNCQLNRAAANRVLFHSAKYVVTLEQMLEQLHKLPTG